MRVITAIASLLALAAVTFGSANAQPQNDQFSKETVWLNNAKLLLSHSMNTNFLIWLDDVTFSDLYNREMRVYVSYYGLERRGGKQTLEYSKPFIYASLKKEGNEYILTERNGNYLTSHFSDGNAVFDLLSSYDQVEIRYSDEGIFTKINGQDVSFKLLSKNDADSTSNVAYIFYDDNGVKTGTSYYVLDKNGRIIDNKGHFEGYSYTNNNQIVVSSNILQLDSVSVNDVVENGSDYYLLRDKMNDGRWAEFEVYSKEIANDDGKHHKYIYKRYFQDLTEFSGIKPLVGKRVYIENGRDDLIAIVKGYGKDYFMGRSVPAIILKCDKGKKWEFKDINTEIAFPYPEAFETGFLRLSEDENRIKIGTEVITQGNITSPADSIKQAKKERRKSRLEKLRAAAAAAAAITEAVTE